MNFTYSVKCFYVFRMDLFFEKSAVITERMFNLEVKLEDPENYVYHIPGIDAHGNVTLPKKSFIACDMKQKKNVPEVI